MTGEARVLTVGSSSSTLTSTSSASPKEAQICYYCANIKLLREVIPPKRCDYKKVLPKVMKGNSRICIQCFSQHWQDNGLNTSSNDKKSRRDSSATGKRPSSANLDGRESFIIDSSRPSSFIHDSNRDSFLDSNRRDSMTIDSMWAGEGSFDEQLLRSSFLNAMDEDQNAVPSLRYRAAPSSGVESGNAENTQSLISAVDLWISIVTASILVIIVLLEGFSLQQRLCYCVAAYGVFLTLHPWFHSSKTSSRSNGGAKQPSKLTTPSTAGPQLNQATQPTKILTFAEETHQLGALPEEYKRRKVEMAKKLKYYLSDECPWKVIKTTSNGVISEMAMNDTPYPLFKFEMFIGGVPMERFIDFLDRKDMKDRSLWDLNVANFRVIESFAEEKNVFVCHNMQKSFLGGLVAARDFSLLYVREKDCISFCSVEHPGVPVTSSATRANLFVSCFHCREATGEDGSRGFILTYLYHVDIGGSLPSKLVYNGSIDNMIKVMKVFKSPKKLLRQ
ncbi:Sodium-coupled neutral amino acid transporter 6, partial [Globisporangium splendens]